MFQLRWLHESETRTAVIATRGFKAGDYVTELMATQVDEKAPHDHAMITVSGRDSRYRIR